MSNKSSAASCKFLPFLLAVVCVLFGGSALLIALSLAIISVLQVYGFSPVIVTVIAVAYGVSYFVILFKTNAK